MDLIHEYERRARAANVNARGRMNAVTRVEWFKIADEWARLADARMKEVGIATTPDEVGNLLP